MGLINYLQDEEERVQRRAQQQVGRYNRNVDRTKAEMAPHQKTVEDFNKSAEDYNSGWYNGGVGYFQNSYGLFAPTGQTYIRNQASLSSIPQEYGNKIYLGESSIRARRRVGVRGAEEDYYESGPVYAFNKYAKPDDTSAKASNEFLKSKEGDIDKIKRRGEIVERNAGREAERLQATIAMNKSKAMEEAAASQNGNPNSVFDQNMAGVFQSISDWLKG